MIRQRLFEAIDRLRPWKRGGTRAPHKPLTLLWALGRVRGRQPRLASFAADAQEPIACLLKEFGPPRKTAHPENPFWHLQSEGEGELWAVVADEPLSLPPRRSPTRRDLEAHGVRAGLSKALHDRLCRDPELLRETSDRILFTHFPESLHDAIRDAVGLPRDAMTRGAMVREGNTGDRAPRDPEFRHAVLRAYERRCAVCDFDLQIAGDLFGLEAAHIRWHSHDGPDLVPNGLALCVFHHRALDRGVIGLEPAAGAHHLLVSNEVSGQSPAFRELLDSRGKPLRPPQEHSQQPDAGFVAWHRREVFRGEPRSRPGL
ncbi:MAG: restriction endonuclease [Acidobacteria bacterium]|nr:restriction endonuclease [Acidobacteriota bacterium]